MFDGVMKGLGRIRCNDCFAWFSRADYAVHVAHEVRGEGSAKSYRCSYCFEWFSAEAFVAHYQSEDTFVDGRTTITRLLAPERRYPGPLELSSLAFVHDRCGAVNQCEEAVMRSFFGAIGDFHPTAHCAQCRRRISMTEARWVATGENMASYFARHLRPLEYGGNPAPKRAFAGPVIDVGAPTDGTEHCAVLRGAVGDAPRQAGAFWRWFTAPKFDARYSAPEAFFPDYVRSVEAVWNHGRVGWAAIIQANATLFNRGTNSAPAHVVTSVDPFFDQRPAALGALAAFVADSGGFEWDDPAVSALASVTVNQCDAGERVEIPASVTGGPSAWCTWLLVDREFLPARQITAEILPAIVDAETGRAVLIPHTRWPLSLGDWLPPAQRDLARELLR